jgi:hypothetical protein
LPSFLLLSDHFLSTFDRRLSTSFMRKCFSFSQEPR